MRKQAKAAQWASNVMHGTNKELELVTVYLVVLKFLVTNAESQMMRKQANAAQWASNVMHGTSKELELVTVYLVVLKFLVTAVRLL